MTSHRRPGVGKVLGTRARAYLPVLAFGVLLLAAWKLLVVAGDYPPFILPAPDLVAERWLRAWLEGTMAPHAQATVLEILLGFVIAALLAVPAGYLLARSALAERLLSPYLVAAQATPVLALAPLVAL